MSYASMYDMAHDADLLGRVTACAAEQGQELPELWAHQHRYHVCAQPGWSDAWDSAAAAAVERPGRDPGVITDGMILAGVQAVAG